ncbi:hypothetical protein GCM10025791_17620 [Halioxenophilus aromaticivorans]|uniref:Uncharacterized protein n=2 Tax=Halioxenophilus aromaticivorans TaxID=1306992 RepID=A0AAV3U0S5_9ALTE
MACFLLEGCVHLKSTQLSGLSALLSEKEDPLLPYEWQIQWGEYQKNVYAVDLNPVYVFGNVFGDGVTLENMRIREAEGLGKFNHLWQFIERGEHIMAYESGVLRATFNCGGWRMVSREPVVRLEQNCTELKGHLAVNSIELDAAGNVSKLVYSLFEGRPSLILSKLQL